MNNQEVIKQMIQNKKEGKDNRNEFHPSNGDAIVFVPDENIRAIERTIDNWERVKKIIMNQHRFIIHNS